MQCTRRAFALHVRGDERGQEAGGALLGVGEVARLLHDLLQQHREVVQLAEDVLRHVQQALRLLAQPPLLLERPRAPHDRRRCARALGRRPPLALAETARARRRSARTS